MAFKKDNKIKSNFSQIRISLASPEEILENSSGEVLKPETVNYRTYKPERDGLFCERIFGPVKDFECHCGKYKRIRYRGIVCDRCGVEVTEKKVRRERMGHIKLEVPIAHVWYFRSLPNKMGYLLGLSTKKLESIIYYERYVLIQGGVLQSRINDDLTKETAAKSLDKDPNPVFTEEQYLDYLDYLDQEYPGNAQLEDSDPEKFICKTGAEAIYDMLARLDLDALSYELRHRASTDGSQQRKNEALKRLQVVESFRASKNVNRPEWMIMKVLPVIPPDLRPLVPLDGGRFATSDLNDLYRRVIIRNNRLKRMIEIKAPEVILRNEKRMLQEAVDSLFDNSRKSSAVRSDNNRPLKSLSDSLKGKQGRFRQNLLGKRVDYSARSVIVVGPELKMHECGLPKYMAAELYKPFVIRKLIERGIVKTVKSAKKIVDRKDPVVWDILEHVMKGHPVLLNRAPTLHRLGIQAFQPKMIEGKAIQLHPLSCTAFNADFDGDQMAVHLPLGNEAILEAQMLMLASHNILNPANGAPITVPSQDMVLGLYYITKLRPGAKGDGYTFYGVEEATIAYNEGKIDLHAPIKVYVDDVKDGEPIRHMVDTSMGRLLVNEYVPKEVGYVNEVLGKKSLRDIIGRVIKVCGVAITAQFLDDIKNLGYYMAFKGGLSFNLGDVIIPEEKAKLIAEGYEAVEEIMMNYSGGFITNNERYNQIIDTWTHVNSQLTGILMKHLSEDNQGFNSVFMMMDSGARGSKEQIRQLSGIRGLMAKPQKSGSEGGQIIENPILSNFKEGLSVLEYFISTHGARKGLADTALKTADAGYLTRRLVDVSQDVIVREADCGTRQGVRIKIAQKNSAGEWEAVDTIETTAYARTLARDAVAEDGTVVAPAGSDLGDDLLAQLVAAGVEEVVCRSVLTCESQVGTCATCYGRSLATGKQVDIGEAVGIIAAQSIGEPGTQLTMRTFHTGGAASAADITQGLPRVQELFEARSPKVEAKMNEAAGRVHIDDEDPSARKVVITRDDGKEDLVIEVSRRQKLLVSEGQHIEAGTPLTEGQLDPKEILRIMGRNVSQKMLVDEVQKVYRDQGVGIHAKHIEVIVRQMLRRVTILEPGDTTFMPGELVDRMAYLTQNRRVAAEGGQPASGRQMLMGITKASLATDSWLSAASFQETTKVLTEAAMNGKSDSLVGLKENVILGKLIPAGTGLSRYNDVIVEPTAEAMANSNYSEADFGDGSVSEDFLDALGAIDFGMNFRE